MKPRLPQLGMSCLLAWMSFFTFACHAATTDLRVLIDVSGSMKKNDPDNIRVPALRLLIGLLPEKTKTGVWLFEGKTATLIPVGKINRNLRKRSHKLTKRIHSRGQRTNIEQALRTALKGWETPDNRYKRHLILLTDGMIDVSKNEADNQKSRHRILQEIIPRYKKAGVKIHTIALSGKSDRELLYALSSKTQAWHEEIKNSKKLHKIFLRLFDRSTKTDKVPLAGNRFSIDKSITDMTVLAFRSKNSKQTALITPDKKRWTFKNHPKTFSWYREKQYDMITIKKPTAGKWRLIADLDPDNRVSVVTNLKLQVSKIPDSVLAGDILNLTASLKQKNALYQDNRFLRLVRFSLDSDNPQIGQLSFSDDGKQPDVRGKDGVYSLRLNNLVSGGTYSLAITAKSKTFERISNSTLRIYTAPAKMSVHKPALNSDNKAKPDSQYTIRIQPYPGLLDTSSVKIKLKLPDGKLIETRKTPFGIYLGEVPVRYHGKTIQVVVVAKRLDGTSLNQQYAQALPDVSLVKPLKLAAKPIEKQPAEKPVEKKPLTESKPAKAKKKKKKLAKKRKKKKRKKRKRKKKKKKMLAKVNWLVVISGVVGANLLLIFGGIFLMSRKKKQTDIDLDSEGDENE